MNHRKTAIPTFEQYILDPKLFQSHHPECMLANQLRNHTNTSVLLRNKVCQCQQAGEPCTRKTNPEADPGTFRGIVTTLLGNLAKEVKGFWIFRNLLRKGS